jgi:hypothetical protein
LLSEAEHEWLARDGKQLAFTLDCVASVRARREPRSRFSIKNLHFEEWMEDDWHPIYEAAPTSSVPWLSGDPRGVYRGGLLLSAVQSDSEYVLGFAALRFPGPRKGPHKQSSEVRAPLALFGAVESHTSCTNGARFRNARVSFSG